MNRAGQALTFLSWMLIAGCCKHEPMDSSGQAIAKGYMNRDLVIPGRDEGTGPLYVLGTADFYSSGGGAVLIKVQVENFNTAGAGPQAKIRVWSGQGGGFPTDTTTMPPSEAPVYATNGDTDLRHTTEHLDRTYDPGTNSYWLVVEVDRAPATSGDPRPPPTYHLALWNPNENGVPDEAHEFNQL